MTDDGKKTIMPEGYLFKVNGGEIYSPHQKIIALDILQLAKSKGAFPGKPEEYVLEGDKGQYKLDALVDLKQDNIFITILNKSTPVAFFRNTLLIKTELESLGYKTSVSKSYPRGEVVTFSPYKVETGSYKGKVLTVGISMHGEEPYPEYPPHWIHLPFEINDGRGGAVEKYQDEAGQEWVAMSRPPGPMWDELPTKHMPAYLKEHLRCFWSNV